MVNTNSAFEMYRNDPDVQLFERLLNQSLENNFLNYGVAEKLILKRRPELEEILSNVTSDFKESLEPTEYKNVRINDSDPVFDEIYALMEHIFEPDVLDPETKLKSSIEETNNGSAPSPCILVARMFEAPGDNTYDLDGNLIEFHHNPEKTTSRVVSFTSGNYMPLIEQNTEKYSGGIAAIGHTATVENSRSHGHGTLTVEYFEKMAKEIADNRGEVFHGLVCEAEGRSKGFWYKKGFLWPENTK